MYEQQIAVLKGKIITSINWYFEEDRKVLFTCDDGSQWLMYHRQDCCESVYLEDVVGDRDDLLNSVVVDAYETTDCHGGRGDDDSHTWTFYTIQTLKGAVTLRWYGSSNGYYSESVDFEQYNDGETYS